MQDLAQALRMLGAFASVGAQHFDVTFLDIDGVQRGFRAHQSITQVLNSLPILLPGLTERQNSLILRPRADGKVTLVQLDDLDNAKLALVENIAFLTLCTSPGNHQAWVAVSGVADAKDFARRLRKGIAADPGASGASRCAGTVNYKRLYEPDFPNVKLLSAILGHIVRPDHFEHLRLLAPPDPVRTTPPFRVPPSGRRSWPDYQLCLANAPLNHAKTGPDISRADFFWCLLAAQRGWRTQEVAERLMELSSKAAKNGESYARQTAEHAAEVHNRQGRGRG